MSLQFYIKQPQQFLNLRHALNQCYRFVTYWYGSGSPDPYHGLTPALFLN
jgi:hypothetical protein